LRELKPPSLSRDLRIEVTDKAKDAIRQASSKDKKDLPAVITDLKAKVNELHKLLARNVNELPANEYIGAKRFLNSLDDAIRALEDPNVGNYFNQTYVAMGPSVRQLVDYMRKNGLTFAPAVVGDEPAYQALHGALAAYDQELHQRAPANTKEEKEKDKEE
jgi:hypothetical protein